MLTIKYKLPNYPENQYLSFEGRLYKDENYTIPYTTEWNGETTAIYDIYSRKYFFSANVKESDYLELQNLQYAFDIWIQENEIWQKYQFESISVEQLVGEFKKVTIQVKNVQEKQFSNKVLNLETIDFLTFNNGSTTLNVNLYFRVLKNAEFIKSDADDFSNIISDYTKQRIFYDVRIFVNSTDYFNLLDHLQTFDSNSFIKIGANDVQCNNYLIQSNERIANDLYVLDLKLIQSTTVKSKY